MPFAFAGCGAGAGFAVNPFGRVQTCVLVGVHVSYGAVTTVCTLFAVLVNQTRYLKPLGIFSALLVLPLEIP